MRRSVVDPAGSKSKSGLHTSEDHCGAAADSPSCLAWFDGARSTTRSVRHFSLAPHLLEQCSLGGGMCASFRGDRLELRIGAHRIPHRIALDRVPPVRAFAGSKCLGELRDCGIAVPLQCERVCTHTPMRPPQHSPASGRACDSPRRAYRPAAFPIRRADRLPAAHERAEPQKIQSRFSFRAPRCQGHRCQ